MMTDDHCVMLTDEFPRHCPITSEILDWLVMYRSVYVGIHIPNPLYHIDGHDCIGQSSTIIRCPITATKWFPVRISIFFLPKWSCSVEKKWAIVFVLSTNSQSEIWSDKREGRSGLECSSFLSVRWSRKNFHIRNDKKYYLYLYKLSKLLKSILYL